MTAYVKKLASVYREQLFLYKQIYSLVQTERQALLQSRPLGEIIESLRSKRDVLRLIEKMDILIDSEKSCYQRNKLLLDAGETHELNKTIKEIKNVIQQIMEVERSNEETIVSSSESPDEPGQFGEENVLDTSVDNTVGRTGHAGQRYLR
jgi:flagellar biosynthesis/type III secretory pathway chaperone